MTEPWEASGIGKRIAAFRKRRGMTARELAEAIHSDVVSTAVIQNIEAGRKPDLTVSQLLNIARGLGVSPLFLLAPVGRPFEALDLPNLSTELGTMNVSDFDNWVSVATARGVGSRDIELRVDLQSFRELIATVPGRDLLRRKLRAQLDEISDDESAEGKLMDLMLESDRVERRVKGLAEELRGVGWDVSWAEPLERGW